MGLGSRWVCVLSVSSQLVLWAGNPSSPILSNVCGGKRALFTSPAVSQAPILGLVFVCSQRRRDFGLGSIYPAVAEYSSSVSTWNVSPYLHGVGELYLWTNWSRISDATGAVRIRAAHPSSDASSWLRLRELGSCATLKRSSVRSSVSLRSERSDSQQGNRP